jgi:hypothetical protein
VPGTTIQGNTVMMTWVCRACGQDRPITRGEQVERRRGQPDRRRKSRHERRAQ